MEDSLTTHEEFKRLRAENARLQARVAEAQGKLKRIETDMCACNRGQVGMCIAHDKNSLLARILSKEGNDPD